MHSSTPWLHGGFGRGRESQPRLRAQIHRLIGAYDRGEGAAHGGNPDIRLLKLLRQASAELRIEAAERLAGVPQCPSLIARALACDADAEVACPILRRSTALCDRTLAEMALCKGQLHLEALAGRRNLPQGVARILVRRGDRLTLQALARNRSAELAPHCRRRLRARLGLAAPLRGSRSEERPAASA